MAINHQDASIFDASASPQPQPLTKRDVRRNRIMEKLQAMVDGFATNQNQHYRAQLQGVQVDMTLVLRAEPYAEGALPDSHEEIRELVEAVMQSDASGNGGVTLPDDENVKTDFWATAGKRYGEFAREVNDAIEKRDADLTLLHNNHEAALQELDRLHQQRLRQAEEEHRELSNTIRQRLIGTLNKKRQQLLRDKDQLDISDSNAMLLHPNHFSINNNRASPSHNGLGVNKRTRHLRHHRGASPAPAGADSESSKRKRKLGAEDDNGNESPIPNFGGRSPFKEAKSTREYAQFEAPAYSLERLFTEKELALATDLAKKATYKYFYQKEQEPSSNGNGTAVPSLDGEVVESGEGQADETMADANGTNTPPPSEPPAAVGMERQTSHQVLTRGGAKANPLAALSDLANAAAAASSTEPVVRKNPFTPEQPSFHATSRAEKSGAPQPPPVSSLDMENDFNMMRDAGADHYLPDQDGDVEMDTLAADEAKELRRRLLDQALGVSGVQAPYRLPQLEPGPGAMIGRGVDREPRTGFAPVQPVVVRIESRLKNNATEAAAHAAGGAMAAALNNRLGAEPMSRTTSAGGFSEMGEPAAPRGRGGRGRLV
ncbi:hypothetical protein CB0940_07821 [Cercospora beticola]|uniref:Uncharacterized protein n=1 Tax=Cercospora beticola TaxID=122368 RepID=A0A2G5HA51_CERBT|nr:hypothetical protein CB0940_07821 [Cercospora beticola]PIA89173.1 hypothetical protein CB0940_07821 [Cercospora beticola]WPB03790.1 hypothetical protein RHO25_008434 [Cercospora beticola]CAK1357443.1 unnamed protein product [Cercospora beticola]